MYDRAKPEKSVICKHLRRATESVNAAPWVKGFYR